MNDTIEHALASVAERVQRSIVAVKSRAGGGTGTIWDADGLIVTNHHVVPDAAAEIVLPDGRTAAAIVVARDVVNDLALLRAQASDLSPIAREAQSDVARVGALVMGVGNPWGQRGFVTFGVIASATITGWRGAERRLIRADLRLAPGNSGGPLVDATGALVGINSMIDGGMALAVPTAIIETFVHEAVLQWKPNAA